MAEFKYEIEDKELLEMMEKVNRERVAAERERVEIEMKCQAARYRKHVIRTKKVMQHLENFLLVLCGASVASGIWALLSTTHDAWSGLYLLVCGLLCKVVQQYICNRRKEVGT